MSENIKALAERALELKKDMSGYAEPAPTWRACMAAVALNDMAENDLPALAREVLRLQANDPGELLWWCPGCRESVAVIWKNHDLVCSDEKCRFVIASATPKGGA